MLRCYLGIKLSRLEIIRIQQDYEAKNKKQKQNKTKQKD